MLRYSLGTEALLGTNLYSSSTLLKPCVFPLAGASLLSKHQGPSLSSPSALLKLATTIFFFPLGKYSFMLSLCHAPCCQYLLEGSFYRCLVPQFLQLWPRGHPLVSGLWRPGDMCSWVTWDGNNSKSSLKDTNLRELHR